MKIMQAKLKTISIIISAIFMFFCSTTSFSAQKATLVMKVNCKKEDGSAKDPSECKEETLTLNARDIQCIAASIDREKTEYPQEANNDSQSKNTKSVYSTSYSINFKLTKSGAAKLQSFSAKNIGNHVATFYKNVLIGEPVFATAISANFTLARLSKSQFFAVKKMIGVNACRK